MSSTNKLQSQQPSLLLWAHQLRREHNALLKQFDTIQASSNSSTTQLRKIGTKQTSLDKAIQSLKDASTAIQTRLAALEAEMRTLQEVNLDVPAAWTKEQVEAFRGRITTIEEAHIQHRNRQESESLSLHELLQKLEEKIGLLVQEPGPVEAIVDEKLKQMEQRWDELARVREHCQEKRGNDAGCFKPALPPPEQPISLREAAATAASDSSLTSPRIQNWTNKPLPTSQPNPNLFPPCSPFPSSSPPPHQSSNKNPSLLALEPELTTQRFQANNLSSLRQSSSTSLQAYFEQGTEVLANLPRRQEARVVEAFWDGLMEEEAGQRKGELESLLERDGWCWEVVRKWVEEKERTRKLGTVKVKVGTEKQRQKQKKVRVRRYIAVAPLEGEGEGEEEW